MRGHDEEPHEDEVRAFVFDTFERVRKRRDAIMMESFERAAAAFEDLANGDGRGDEGTGTISEDAVDLALIGGGLDKAIRRGRDYNDAVQFVLSKYAPFYDDVKHGVNVRVGKHKGVSWNVEHNPTVNTATISYSEGGEWTDDLYPESVPSWLLLHLIRRVKKHEMMARDRDAHSEIARIESVESWKIEEKYLKEAMRSLKLNTQRGARILGGGGQNHGR